MRVIDRRNDHHGGDRAGDEHRCKNSRQRAAIDNQSAGDHQREYLRHGDRIENDERHRHRDCCRRAAAAANQPQHGPPNHAHPAPNEKCRQVGHGAEEEAAEGEGEGAEHGRFDAQWNGSQEQIHADEREVDVKDDVQRESESERADENQPLRRIKNFIRRISGHRLPAAEIWVPPRKIAAGDRVAHDLLHGVVIGKQVAEKEVIAEEEDVGKEKSGDGDEQDQDPPIAHPPRPVILNTTGMITKSCTASKIPCAMTPGMRFFVR